MATPTYTPIANATLGAAAATITLSSISQSYRDLILVLSSKQLATSNQNPRGRLNGDAGSNYYLVYMDGYGTGAGSTGFDNANASFSVLYVGGGGYADPTPSVMQFMDYSATDKQKTVLIRSGNANFGVSAYAMRWASTAAITSITLYGSTQNFEAGTTVALYGIAS